MHKKAFFAPHAAGPVVCLKSAMETAGLGFQPMLQPHCVCLVCDCVRGHSCVTCQTQSGGGGGGGGAVTHPTAQWVNLYCHPHRNLARA